MQLNKFNSYEKAENHAIGFISEKKIDLTNYKEIHFRYEIHIPNDWSYFDSIAQTVAIMGVASQNYAWHVLIKV